MGLFDFLSNEGDKKPVEPANKPAAGGASDFFGTNANAANNTAAAGDTYTVVSGDSLSKIAKTTTATQPNGTRSMTPTKALSVLTPILLKLAKS